MVEELFQDIKPDYGITHAELCLKTAQRFTEKIALYEYKSSVSQEEPDVLVFGYNGTILFEIKMSMSDFNADSRKECRKKFKIPYYVDFVERKVKDAGDKWIKRQLLKLRMEQPKIFLQEKSNLGNFRYFVCPDKLIPVEKLPEGWGLIYYKKGKFYSKKGSKAFRSNLRKENHLLIHAMRRYGSGDTTGIFINSYNKIDQGGKDKE
jgi:hypothetical protein